VRMVMLEARDAIARVLDNTSLKKMRAMPRMAVSQPPRSVDMALAAVCKSGPIKKRKLRA